MTTPNPYDSPDNYDSPFHRIKESDTDRQIHALKTEFAAKLREKISAFVPGIRELEIAHPQLSSAIFIVFKHSNYRVHIGYEMDKKTFSEPRTTIDKINIAVNGGNLVGFYDSDSSGQELRWRIERIMEFCYDISKMVGFGTQRGGNWLSETRSVQLAANEFVRLLEANRESIQREKEQKEAKAKKDKEFLDRLLRR
jgi:hypothetical protein